MFLKDPFYEYAILAAVGVCGLRLLRQYFKGPRFTEPVNAKDKVVLITGANAGLGLEMAKEMNLRGAKVYMLCRDGIRAREAIAKLAQEGCNAANLVFEQLDLVKLDSVRQFVDRFQKLEDHIDILINNAAIWPAKFELSPDGSEMGWQTNYLSHFLLIELLLPLLKKAPAGGRIVNISAKLHMIADSVSPEVINDPSKFSGFMSYNRSKLAQIMHTRSLAKRLQISDDGQCSVTVNACHPGVFMTDLLRQTAFGGSLVKLALTPANYMFYKTTADAAQTPIFLALSSQMNGVSGKYYSDCAGSTISKAAQDDQACEDLFQYSMKAVGLSDQ